LTVGAITVGSTIAFVTTFRDNAAGLSHISSPANDKVSSETNRLTPGETTGSDSETSGLILGRLSPAETKEIANMLLKIGYGSDYDVKIMIRQYQRDNGLSPSGCLDVRTLDGIVSAARLDRVQTLEEKLRFE